MNLKETAMVPVPFLRPLKRLRPPDPAVVFNHLMFATLTFFMIQQQLVDTRPAMASGTWVAQALHYQPRTPPPMLDAEQLYTEEAILE